MVTLFYGIDSNMKELEENIRKTFSSLDIQKKEIENEADKIILELTTPPTSQDGQKIEPAGIDTPLVDSEGYPRNDINLHRARTLRNRLNILKTNHKEITNKIESLLVQLAAVKKSKTSPTDQDETEKQLKMQPKPKPKYDAITGKWVCSNWDGTVAGIENGDQIQFNNLNDSKRQITKEQSDDSLSKLKEREPQQPNTSTEDCIIKRQKNDEYERPFAKIDDISNNSPAQISGLKVDDLICHFGHIDANNHNNLQALAVLVPKVAANHSSITIVVKRRQSVSRSSSDASNEDEYVELKLFPHPFDGRGLLGCHIIPIE